MERAYLTLEFDDSFKETLECILPILEKKNIPAGFAVVAGLIGKKLDGKKLVGDKQLFILAKKNHELISHGFTHAALAKKRILSCLLYTSPSPRDLSTSRMPSSA